MKIAARVSNTISGQAAEVETDGRKQSIAIAPKNTGRGSSLNGGELKGRTLIGKALAYESCARKDRWLEAGLAELEEFAK